jgi:hypothetical protein
LLDLCRTLGVQATVNSVRSYLAPAVCRA